MKEGRQEGIKEGRQEVAKTALAKGYSPELIHEITGLDVETIRNFQ
jgi:predicted transposase/invertase (TIGR01784 family)